MTEFRFDPESHLYYLDGKIIPGYSEIAAEVGLIDASWFTPESAHRGTAVHQLCAMIDRGQEIPEPIPEIRGYVEAWKAFCEQEEAQWETIEEPTYRDIYLPFACTPDRYGILKTFGRSVVEIKTGAAHPSHDLQLAAQGLCLGRDATRLCVYLSSTGSFTVHVSDTPDSDEIVWGGAVDLYYWKQKNNLLRKRGADDGNSID